MLLSVKSYLAIFDGDGGFIGTLMTLLFYFIYIEVKEFIVIGGESSLKNWLDTNDDFVESKAIGDLLSINDDKF